MIERLGLSPLFGPLLIIPPIAKIDGSARSAARRLYQIWLPPDPQDVLSHTVPAIAS